MHSLLAVLALASLADADPRPAGAPPLPVGIRCLLAAYPEQLCAARPDAVVFCDGTVMPYDDGRPKADHEARLADGDLEDQLSQRYPAAGPLVAPPVDFDPGRIRHEPFFRKMYGGSRAEVARRLTTVRWLRGSVDRPLKVTTVNGVADALQRVSDELDRLPPELRRYVEVPAGTFHWRAVRGTERLSAHSFAIAIDVGVRFSDFWRWVKPGPDGRLTWRNRFPAEVVAVFEAHGFIWGGRWYHFDTMHFEYRPELLHPLCGGALSATP